jgi:hypothetical protein
VSLPRAQAVVFFSWWQALGISGLVYIKVLGAYEDYSVSEVSEGLQDFLICIEMLGFSIAHWRWFHVREFWADGTLGSLAGERLGFGAALLMVAPTDIMREGAGHIASGGGVARKLKKKEQKRAAIGKLAKGAGAAAEAGAGAEAGADAGGSKLVAVDVDEGGGADSDADADAGAGGDLNEEAGADDAIAGTDAAISDAELARTESWRGDEPGSSGAGRGGFSAFFSGRRGPLTSTPPTTAAAAAAVASRAQQQLEAPAPAPARRSSRQGRVLSSAPPVAR